MCVDSAASVCGRACEFCSEGVCVDSAASVGVQVFFFYAPRSRSNLTKYQPRLQSVLMGKGKEAANSDDDTRDVDYRPQRATQRFSGGGSSASLPVRSSARLRHAANIADLSGHVLGVGDIPSIVASNLGVRVFGQDKQHILPRRPMFMHDTYQENAPHQFRFPNCAVANRFHAAMRLGMVNRAWRQRIFGVGGLYNRTTGSPHDANGLYPVGYMVESSRRMLQAMTAAENNWCPWDDERICVINNPDHINLQSDAPSARWDLMRMASRDMYHLHESIDSRYNALITEMEKRIGAGDALDVYLDRMMAVFERRWLNMRFMLGVIYLMAFVCQGLCLRPRDDQTNLILTMRNVMVRFRDMANRNQDYSYMYNTIFERFWVHLRGMQRQFRPYSRNNPYHTLHEMLRVVGRTDDPCSHLAMSFTDRQPIGTNPFYMMHLVGDLIGFAGPGTDNRFRSGRTNLQTLAAQTPLLSGAPIVYATGQPLLHHMIPGQQPRGSLAANPSWTVTSSSRQWATSVEVAFAWALQRAMGDRGVVPVHMWVSNVGRHPGENIWNVFVNRWRGWGQTSTGGPVGIDEGEAQDSV